MKTEIIISGLIAAIIISSCTSPRYLPSSDRIDVNEYGSFINIARRTTSNVTGELIAIDSNKITVLTEDAKEFLNVPIPDVQTFELRYAQPKHYGWAIPVYTLATLSHGVFLIATAPINLIVTISVTAGGENAFKYSNKNMTYDKLRMFARFPQGIPTNIDLSSIK